MLAVTGTHAHKKTHAGHEGRQGLRSSEKDTVITGAPLMTLMMMTAAVVAGAAADATTPEWLTREKRRERKKAVALLTLFPLHLVLGFSVYRDPVSSA